VVWPRWVVVRGSGGVAKLLLLLHTLRLLGFQSLAERVGVDVSAFVVGKIVVLLGNPSRGKPDPPQLCPPFPISSNRYSNKTTMKILAMPRWRPPGCPARRHTRESEEPQHRRRSTPQPACRRRPALAPSGYPDRADGTRYSSTRCHLRGTSCCRCCSVGAAVGMFKSPENDGRRPPERSLARRRDDPSGPEWK
jgi:hypothetical protein